MYCGALEQTLRRNKTSATEEQLAAALDPEQLQSTKVHGVKMGKWRKDALEAVRKHDFIVVVKISRAIRQPLSHFDHSVTEKRFAHEPGNLALLVLGEGRQYLSGV